MSPTNLRAKKTMNALQTTLGGAALSRIKWKTILLLMQHGLD